MSNSFASKAASDIGSAQRTANPLALQILARFVKAIQPLNQISLKREFKELGELTDSQMRAALLQLPNDFLTSILVALAVSEQREMLLESIEWIARNKDFGWQVTPRGMSWPETIWKVIAAFISEQPGETEPDRERASTMLDELTRVANLFGEISRTAGINRKAALGPILAQQAAIKAMIEFIEPVFEAGIAEPAAGQEPTILRTLFQQIAAIEEITIDRNQVPTYPLFMVEWDGDRAKIFNAFPPGSGRVYPVLNFSQSDKTLPGSPTIGPGEVLARRRSQIDSILAFYGATLERSAKATKDQARRRQSFAKSEKPASPLDHEGIVRLLIMVFTEAFGAAKTDRAQAGWGAALDLLKILLDQLTVHPGHDLDDNGPNYLTTRFPLTLSGDQLHDCAVYAVRAAFWLHSLAARLRTKQGVNLRIWSRLVTLPAHLALVVGIDPDNALADPEAMPSGGLVFVNNNHLDRVDGLTLASNFATWKSSSPANDKDPKKKEEVRTKFFDDLAAGQFIPEVDMPLAAMPFLENAAKVSTSSIWRRYSEYRTWSRRHEIFGDAVFKGNGDYLEFYLKYLLLLQSRARFVNEVMIAQLWNKDAPDAYDKAMGEDSWDGPRARAAMQRYVEEIDAVADKYDDKISKFQNEPDELLNQSEEFEMYRKKSQAKGGPDKLSHKQYLTLITEDFDAKGKIIVGAGARRVFSSRNANSSVEDHLGAYLEEIKTHTKDCKVFLSGSSSKSEPPPKPPFKLESRYQQVL